MAIGAIFLIILLIIWLTFADITGNTDVAAFLISLILLIILRGCLIMFAKDRAENFEAELFLRQRSIAGYATEAKG